VKAITLTHFDGKCTEALTDNYLKLGLPGRHPFNCWISSLVDRVESDTLIATEISAA
jgi:hypothetical protein